MSQRIITTIFLQKSKINTKTNSNLIQLEGYMHGKPKKGNKNVNYLDWYKDNDSGRRAREIMMRCDHPRYFGDGK